jgi:16S rRNA (uracil1498-N3)-methyltransferase
VVAPTKNITRIEWLLEKATEVGVSAFTFIECDHSERKVTKLDRLNKIVQGATKQSVNYFLPVLIDIISFEYFLSKDIEG